MARWIAALATSARFLTRVPVPADLEDVPLKEAVAGFPVIGAVVGLVTGVIAISLFWLGVPALAAAGLALAAGALMTGGLHEDGLADVADGFGGGRTRERKLEIMRDSRIGSYGVIALVLALLIKAAAIAALLDADGTGALLGLIAAGAVSRAAMVWLLATTLPARSDGLGSGAGMPDINVMAVALGIGALVAAVAVGVEAGPWAVLIVAAASICAAFLMRALALRQIGGQTGDVCGALQMITETAFLAVLSAMVH